MFDEITFEIQHFQSPQTGKRIRINVFDKIVSQGQIDQLLLTLKRILRDYFQFIVTQVAENLTYYIR